MLVAAIDTASLTLSVALAQLDGGELRIVAERSERAPTRAGPQGPTGGHGGRLPGALLDLLAEAVPDEAGRRRVLVDNPTRLYWRD